MIQGHTNLLADNFFSKVVDYFKYNSEKFKIEIITSHASDEYTHQMKISASGYTLESNISGTNDGATFDISIRIPTYLRIIFWTLFIVLMIFLIYASYNDSPFLLLFLVSAIVLVYAFIHEFYERKEKTITDRIIVGLKQYIESKEDIFIEYRNVYKIFNDVNKMCYLLVSIILFIYLSDDLQIGFDMWTIFPILVFLVGILTLILQTIYDKKSYHSAQKMVFISIQDAILFACASPLLLITIFSVVNISVESIPIEIIKQSNLYHILIKTVSPVFYATISLIILCFILFPIVISGWKSASGVDIEYKQKVPIKEREDSKNIIIQYIIYGFWLVSTSIFIVSLYFNGMVLFQTFLGLSLNSTVSSYLDWMYILLPDITNGTIQNYYSIKIILIILSLPPLIFFSFILLNMIKENILFRFQLENDIDSEFIKSFIKRVCITHGIKPPKIKVIDSKEIALSIRSFGFVRRNDILVITQGAIDSLKENKICEEGIKFIIMHEIGHIINDTKFQNLLRFLSQITLFGYSFLTMVVDFKFNEEWADKFAIQNLSKDDIKIIQRGLVHIHTYNNTVRRRKKVQKSQNRLNILNLYLHGYKKFYHIYFTRRLIAYTHLDDLSKRLELIEKEWNKNRQVLSCI